MTDSDDLLNQLRALAAEDKRLEAAREQIKKQVVELAITAIRQGIEPGDVYNSSPYSHVWLRAQIREAGIPKAKPGTKPRARQAAMTAKKQASVAQPTPKPASE